MARTPGSSITTHRAHGIRWLGRTRVGRAGAATPRSTSPDALIYAIAALAAIGILMLWLRRKRKTQDAL